MIRIIIL